MNAKILDVVNGVGLVVLVGIFAFVAVLLNADQNIAALWVLAIGNVLGLILLGSIIYNFGRR